MTDASGQYSSFATEKALLGMSGLQKEKFVEACKDGSLHLHRCNIRVSRTLRTVHNGTPSQTDYVNLVLEDASPLDPEYASDLEPEVLRVPRTLIG